MRPSGHGHPFWGGMAYAQKKIGNGGMVLIFHRPQHIGVSPSNGGAFLLWNFPNLYQL